MAELFTIHPIDRNSREFAVCRGSGLLTVDTLIYTGFGIMTGIIVFTNGSSDAIATVYDNTSASGKVLYKVIVNKSDRIGGITSIPVNFENGVYIEISGTGAEAIVYYIN